MLIREPSLHEITSPFLAALPLPCCTASLKRSPRCAASPKPSLPCHSLSSTLGLTSALHSSLIPGRPCFSTDITPQRSRRDGQCRSMVARRWDRHSGLGCVKGVRLGPASKTNITVSVKFFFHSCILAVARPTRPTVPSVCPEEVILDSVPELRCARSEKR